MLCDQCNEVVDEVKGYLTIFRRLEIIWSRRIDGKLVNDPAIEPDIQKEHVCMACAKSNPVSKARGR